MSVMLDPRLAFVLSVIVGVAWPEADEDKLGQAAQHMFGSGATSLRTIDPNGSVDTYDDNPGTGAPESFEEHRRWWES
jgi:hypothetical protein